MGIRQQDVDPETWRRLTEAADAQQPAARGPAPAAGRKRPAKPELVPEEITEGILRREYTIPLRLDPTTNGGAVKRQLVGAAGRHRRAVARVLAKDLDGLAVIREVIDDGRPVRCAITRLGGGRMDDDNLPPTAKWVRDTVALFLGVDDGPTGPISWEYDQEPGGPWGVRVRLEVA